MNSFSFRKKPPKNVVDYKARLEYKLYLAREDPEPVFDLSECNLKSVPSGVYSLCKVFRKERLLLQVNQLTGLTGGGQLSDLALLVVLDLHNNHISTLPEDIRHLTNLLELNISSNELKKLPESLGSLCQLRELNCSDNKLSSLPASLAQLSCLTKLDLQGNPLASLPPSLASLAALQQLLVSPQSLCDPPPEVASKGTAAMLQFLSQKNGTEYKSWKFSVAEEEPQKSINAGQITENSSLVQDSYKSLGKKKEEKLQELLEVERNLQEQKSKEFEMHENMKQDKNKLLQSLKEQQRKLEQEVTRFQTQKEQERGKLLEHLLEVECQAGEAVADLLAVNQALRLSSQWQEQEARDQNLLAEYKTRTVQLRRQEVIDAMESLLAEECSRKEKLLAYEKNRSIAIQNSLLKEVEWGGQVGALLSAREGLQAALVSAVEADTEMQKALVADLLERSDLRARGLVLQVAMVEQQLAVLTAVELQRRNVHSEQQLNNLAEKRKTLSDLLVGLLQEQRERQRQLVNTLHQLDYDSQMCGSSPDYWLRQYQRLLDMMPHQLVPDLDPALVHQLVSSGVAHCLPFLSCCDIHSLSHSKLTQIGVTNLEDQNAIMQAVETYLTHNAAQFLPSAPPPQHEASAPPLSPPTRQPLSECVVCMEAECAIVFVPCGHLCTCTGCAIQLSLCPLCRASLDRKIHIILP